MQGQGTGGGVNQLSLHSFTIASKPCTLCAREGNIRTEYQHVPSNGIIESSFHGFEPRC